MLLMKNCLAGLICCFCVLQIAAAQELEPRRWSHLPVGANFAGVGYVYTDSDIFFNPTMDIEDATGDLHTAVFSYVRALDVFGKSGRIDVLVPYTNGRWEGLLEGEPASTRRSGFNDPRIRFAVNLLGSPAQRGEEFRQYKVNTIVGAAIEITAPLGEYQDDKLINLGQNRWRIRPQLGVLHNWDKWAAEVTSSVFLYTDNDDFSGDSKLEQDPIYALQGHLIYTFRPGLWVSWSAAYGAGGQATIDGEKAGERVGKYLWAASFGYPIDRRQGFKFTFLRGETTKDTGDDFNRLLVAYSVMWGG
jgi:hypothetical protein